MKKTVIAAGLAAVLAAGGGYAAFDYAVPDSVTVVNAGGMLTSPGFLAERDRPYSPPVKKRFGRGKPSHPKHPIGR